MTSKNKTRGANKSCIAYLTVNVGTLSDNYKVVKQIWALSIIEPTSGISCCIICMHALCFGK